MDYAMVRGARRVSAASLRHVTPRAGGSLALWSLGFVALMPGCALAQEISEDWQFSATVYGWLPDIGGSTNFPLGNGSDIHVDGSKVLDHLKMSAQGAFEVQKGHWGVFTDVVYADVGASKSSTRNVEIGGDPLPSGVTADTRFDLKSTIWTVAGSYRIVASPDASLDVLLGARLGSLKQTFDWEFSGSFGPVTPPPLSGTRKASVDQLDGIVGVRGHLALGTERHWVVPYYVDIGAGDSDLTWQGLVGLAYAFSWGDVGVAWRYLDYELPSDGPIADMNFSGPALGATFSW
jgi:hypothetical protein